MALKLRSLRERPEMPIETSSTQATSICALQDVDITPLAGFQFDGFAKRLIKYCQGKFEKPTPIQACTWPLIMQKSDVCGIAKTGSGKTLAFAMPYLSMSRPDKMRDTIFAVRRPLQCQAWAARGFRAAMCFTTLRGHGAYKGAGHADSRGML
eukprot:symbB.v1.2.015977.t1/scaffold1205.1/size131557/16